MAKKENVEGVGIVFWGSLNWKLTKKRTPKFKQIF